MTNATFNMELRRPDPPAIQGRTHALALRVLKVVSALPEDLTGHYHQAGQIPGVTGLSITHSELCILPSPVTHG